MKKELIKEAASVEEAKQLIAAELGVAQDAITYEVLQEPEKKVLGLFGGTAAYAAGIMAEQSTNRFLVDGKEVQLDAYAINGSNYLKLRDIGEAVGFNVYWDSEKHCVQIESDAPYTGIAPAANTENVPLASYEQSEVKPTPQVSDVILCSDGYA